MPRWSMLAFDVTVPSILSDAFASTCGQFSFGMVFSRVLMTASLKPAYGLVTLTNPLVCRRHPASSMHAHTAAIAWVYVRMTV